MSNTEVYYYGHKSQVAHKKPKRIDIQNANAFSDYVHKIFGVDLSDPNVYKGNKIQERYNAFVESDAPNWSKVVATFASSGTYILDEDREKVRNALYVAEAKLDVPFSQLGGLALILEALPQGLVAINHSAVGCCLGYERERDDAWTWFSQKEIREKFLRAAVPTRWTYVDHW